MADHDPTDARPEGDIELLSEEEHVEQRQEARAYAEGVVASATGNGDPEPEPSAAPDPDALLDQVRTAVAGLVSPWTVAQVARAVGLDEAEVLPYVHRLVAGGTIQELGEDHRAHDGGRDPKIYGPA